MSPVGESRALPVPPSRGACGRALDRTETLADAPESALSRLIVDPRDEPHVKLLLRSTLVPFAAAGLFHLGSFPWWLAGAYWLVWAGLFADRFTTMLHCISHRPLFRKRWMNRLVQWLVCPFFGQSPDSFFVHHMGMHHVEDNLDADLSSTMKYQRDDPLQFLCYYGKFILAGPFALALYHARKGNRKLVRQILTGELAFYALCIAAVLWRWQPALVVFIVPFFFTRFMLMAGNWAQHAFVDPDEPANPYRNSITCLGSRYNERCFNDGYHVHHTARPTAHFSELADEFEDNIETYGRADAIVFDRLDFIAVWFLLMTRRIETLAAFFAHLPGAPERGDAEVVQLLRRRLAPIGVAPPSAPPIPL